MDQLTILIVDDEVLTRRALRSSVHWEDLGVGRVLEAGSSDSAKQLLQKEAVDFVLLDIDMPGENGVALLQWIRENLSAEIPCAFLTCHADFSFAQKAVQYNSIGYLLKPVDYAEIEDLILRMVHRTRKEKEQKEINKYGVQWLQERELEGKQHEKTALSTDEIVKNVVVHIRAHLSEKLSLAGLAHEAGLNMNYLNKVFKERMGDTVNQFIIKEKMSLAARMLANGEVRAYAIAESLGYDNYANFVNMFKKIYGIAPSQYAEKKQEMWKNNSIKMEKNDSSSKT